MEGTFLKTIVQLDFPHNYEVTVLPAAEHPAKVRIPDAREDVDSLLLKITPQNGEPWVGAFARGFDTDQLVDGVFAWPDGVSLGVVSSGYGYVVKAGDPKSWVRLQPMPITEVRSVPEHGLLVFADFTNIFAYNAEKNVWKSERLSWDGIKITSLGTNHIFGLGWDAMSDKEVEFVLDVRTGEHTGGARPWARR
jgi:hypothetical protein